MTPTRRQVVQMLAALGLSAAGIADLAAQARRALGAGDLRGALAIQGRELSGDDVEVIRRALQRNIDQFQAVRRLEIDDTVVPLVIFRPSRLS